MVTVHDVPGHTLAPQRHRLQAGELVAEIAPEIGGSLSAFYSQPAGGCDRFDWLRPADDAALAQRSPSGMASFPLVPWCNRIRDGRFDWRGRRVALAPNAPGSPHTIHGLGWQRPWTVEALSARRVELSLVVAGDGEWPFPFRAVQHYELSPQALTVRLAVQNTGGGLMPAGIGHHPYFVHRREGAGTRVTAAVDAIWLADAEVMPTLLSAAHPSVAALRHGMRLADFALDNNFTGYQRTARIDWPDGRSLTVNASPPLDYMVLYSPATLDVFVLEAVSNCTDWINLSCSAAPRASPATVGGRALAPGQILSATTEFRPTPSTNAGAG